MVASDNGYYNFSEIKAEDPLSMDSQIEAARLTLIAENIGGTWEISPQKVLADFWMSLSFMNSHGSR